MVNTKCRVLFVDDEESILFAVADYFVAHGYEVDVAIQVDTARRLLAERTYSVVVIDLCLGPGKERLGLDLMRRVCERHPDTAVVLFTAYGGPDIECETHRQRAVFLEKPLPLPEVRAVIERLGCLPARRRSDDS